MTYTSKAPANTVKYKIKAVIETTVWFDLSTIF